MAKVNYNAGLSHTQTHHLNIETGFYEPSSGHHGIPHTVNYETAIGLDKVSGHTHFRGIGFRSGISATVGGDDIWEGASVVQPFPNQTTGEQIRIKSTSANDTLLGSGAQKMHIHYLDNLGNAQFIEMSFNGVNYVNSIPTNIRFLQKTHVSSIGTAFTTAQGDITIEHISNGTVYDIIKAGDNTSLSAARMVPAGYKFFMNYVCATGSSNKPLVVKLRATCDDEGIITPNVFLYNEVFSIQDSGVPLMLPICRSFPPFTIIKGTATSTQIGGDVTLSYGGWLET